MLFQDQRLGLFLHFGIYAVGGWQEQQMWRLATKKAEYEKYAAAFSPRHGCVDEWLDFAVSCGVEYVAFTAKHHDGFCMWDTALTDYNITHTPYGQDMVREVADGCHRRGLGFVLYYSLPDWHCPFAVNAGGDHQLPCPNPGDTPDAAKYKEYLKAQLTELLTRYGKVDALFWDIPAKEKDPSVNEYVRSLQPHILINDRGYSEGDYSTPERQVPDGLFPRLTEACQSVGMQSWGYREQEDYFSSRFLTESADRILSRGGNYLLNIGPCPDGTLPEEGKAILSRLGSWYRHTREAFDGVAYQKAPQIPYPMTVRENVLYLHLPVCAPGAGIPMRPLTLLPDSATVLNTGEKIGAEVTYLPSFFDFSHADAHPAYLHLYHIPADRITDEPIVIKLSFPKGTDVASLLSQNENFQITL